MKFKATRIDSTMLNAHFSIEGGSIILHARGGVKGGEESLNPDYSVALREILGKLKQSGLWISDSFVVSTRTADLPPQDRRIIDLTAIPGDVSHLFSMLSDRMRLVGRKPGAGPEGGNTTKRIQLIVTPPTDNDRLSILLGGIEIGGDTRSQDRLPSEVLRKVQPDHLWNAVQSLLSGNAKHAFGESTDYDVVLDDGIRLPPKAVFGIGATEALGFSILPKHFSGGESSTCFRILREAGYTIVPKGEAVEPVESADLGTDPPETLEWTEGRRVLHQHYTRERASGLAQAKKAKFKRENGRLFCERCRMDPVVAFGGQVGEACIEVHHKAVAVSQMREGHRTTPEDLMCLCANCHRVEHRKLSATST